MEENKILDNEVVTGVAEEVVENAPELAEKTKESLEAVRSNTNDTWAKVFIILFCIFGVLAIVGIPFVVIFIKDKIKEAKSKKAAKIAETEAVPEEIVEDVIEE